MLSGEKVLFTGPTGRIGLPTVKALARDNEVWAVARFSEPSTREELTRAGVRCAALDIAEGDFSTLPADFTYAVNMATVRTDDFDWDFKVNCEATGLLMQHCRKAKAFLHVSSIAVYQPNGHQPLKETDPLGDSHRIFARMPTYSIAKIGSEVAARTAARMLGLPTTIARLAVPFGVNGGWLTEHFELMLRGKTLKVHTDAPSSYNPIYTDDIIAMIPSMLDVASVPTTIVNWGGSQQSSIQEWCGYLTELTGVTATLVPSNKMLPPMPTDPTRMNQLVGPTTVTWQEGLCRMLGERYPDYLRAAARRAGDASR